PFGQVTDQGVIGYLELRDVDPCAFLLLRVDLRVAGVWNKISLPNPLPVVGRQITFVGRLEIGRFAVVTVIEGEIAGKNELLIVIVIEYHRRGGNRQKSSRF